MNRIMAISGLVMFSLIMFGIAPAASSYAIGTHERYLHCPYKTESSHMEYYITINREAEMKSCRHANSCYRPQILVVDCYSKVTWQNHDTDYHLISSGSRDDGPSGWFASSILNQDDAYSHVFDRPGIYGYYDPTHSWAEGIVVVKSGDSGTDSEWIKFVIGPKCTVGEPNCTHPNLR